MSAVAANSHFGMMEWALFGVLSTGGIVLSYYNQKLYGFIPWISVVMNVFMLLGWQESDPTRLGLILLAFALLYTLSSYWLMWKALVPRAWALLAAGSSLIYYILSYGKFHNWMEGTIFMTKDWYAGSHFWGFLALGLFFLTLGIVIQVLNRFQSEEGQKQILLTIFTLTATAFLSIGLTLELNEEFLTVALGAEILAISWINGYVQIKALRPLAGILTILFGILTIPQILFQILLLSNNFGPPLAKNQQSIFYFYLSDLFTYLQSKVPSINWSLFHLGLPALMFGTSSLLLRKQKDDFIVRAFEMAAIGLITVMAYYLTRHAFYFNENLLFSKSTFIERATLTNSFFLYGLACLWLGRNFKRDAISFSGIVLIGFSLCRILFFDLLLHNPFWSHQYIGSFPLFNVMLLSFGFPILWLTLANQLLTETEKQKYLHYKTICLFALLFFFISFNVSQIYQGPYLDGDTVSNAEVYTYSVAWLLVGLGLLFFGTLWKNKTLRVASLVFVILTIGKVFLYDAAELTGLLRVFSFLGLGLSLLGLSWFYTRFVFKRMD